MPTDVHLDQTDGTMLDLLQKDGRASNVTLAGRLNLSESPCWRRQKRLEENGFIKGYHAHLDRRRLGFGVVAFVQISFSIHRDDSVIDFEQAVQDIPEVLFCHNISGESDYLLQIVTRSLESYEKLSRNVIRRLPGVTSVKTSFSLKEIKHSTQLPISDIQR
ncbi:MULTISPECIES: Lrp/AsnC family transcriptional regulator [Desulfotignum]|uniref:Transcriptional regulator, HTH-type, AsnC family n=1 Tax=Desulfotignum phosphitoxidans DSM 13687 TaxID=1286635 RepID=S0G2F9_9BACT|nr:MULTISPECIES: Lrp/AsnC family transcriptional regulator [Desulfotignum]EMS81533.1 transcriptional regulator, HTH-type, AsnC family [Desulfotignum phosphitoxidans DSM 13687]